MSYRYMPFYVQGNAINGLYYGQWGKNQNSDIDYVKEMYPAAFSKIQRIAESECDREEFAGSMMFDEYPDKLGIMHMVDRVYKQVKKEESECGEKDNVCMNYPDDKWLKDIIMVLLLNEMYRRREKRRKYL